MHPGSPCACSIAGSDSGGGAGIQADIKTFSSLGVWGLTVITAITAQNPKKVYGVWPLPADAVRMQMEAVIEEYDVKCFKTGMLANGEIISTVSESLPGDATLVLDPVMVSTSGSVLLDEDGEKMLKNLLIPKASLITPNLHEAARLAGMESVKTKKEIGEAGKNILDLGAGAVLIKGGHADGGYSTDTFITTSGNVEFRSVRYPFDIHGTGCCLSAAITALLASGVNPEEACRNGKNFINHAIQHGFSGKSGINSVNPPSEDENYNKKY